MARLGAEQRTSHILRSRQAAHWGLLLLLPTSMIAIAGAVFFPLFEIAAICAILVAVVALWLVLKPWRSFWLYLYLLPPHVLVMALLLAKVGLPANLVKLISAWKEGLLFLLLVVMVLNCLRSRTIHIAIPDFFVLAYSAYVALYAIQFFYQERSITEFFYASRDLLLPAVLYCIGRMVSLSDLRAEHVFRWLLIAAGLFSTLGIIERLFVPTAWHVAAGIPRYYQELLGLTFPDDLMGLPENYWTSANSGLIRRAVSVYGQSQPFALSMLLFVPICAYSLFYRRLPENKWAPLLLGVVLAGLALTFTRFTIFISLGLLFLAGIFGNRRARRFLFAGATVGFILFTIALIGSSSLRLMILNTLTFTDTSSSTRLVIWANTLREVLRQPFGFGLGTSGLTASRFGTISVGIEGQYSKIVVELGFVGLILYGSMLLALAIYLMRAASRIPAIYLRGLCFSISLTFFGLTLNSLTTEWHNAIMLVYPVWWLAGSCVNYATRQFKVVES